MFVHEQAVDNIEQAQKLCRTRYFWWVNYLTDYSNFDFLWEPVPWEAHQRHAWPSQWQKDSGTYLVPKNGYTETNYRSDFTLTRYYDLPKWTWPDGFDVASFDWSWHPDPAEPPLVYQFGTQWQKTGGPVYTVPGAVDVKYVDHPRVKKITIDDYWSGPAFDDFDYTWHPDATDPPLIYQFGTQWQKTGGPVYTVPGGTDIKFVDFPRAQKVEVDPNWVIPSDIEFGEFDYTWHPDATDPPFVYQFGTQWAKTGGPIYAIPGATDTKYVDQLRISTQRVASRVYLIDHMDGNVEQARQQIQKHLTEIQVVRYFDNYLDTLKRIARSVPAEDNFVWICSSVCDYENFDFSWHPEQWQAGMLHVFASNEQKFGDTFFMHPSTFRYRSDTCQLLEWYDVNFVKDITVPRRPIPIINHNYDSHVDAVKNMDWAGPLSLFNNGGSVPPTIPTVSLWRAKTKTVIPLSEGASSVIVPKAAVPWVEFQIYDYPHIDKTKKNLVVDPPLDIVFIDNGEPNADANYAQLVEAVGVTCKNRIHRSSGVTGRVAAYHAAAKLSTTPWFFAVFAKLSVHASFDWSWQPDRMQEPKHYIFHAYNPINGLTYGHQAMIAYNKKLVLENSGTGLDFTLDSAHEVVPIVSGTAEYAQSPWMAWRTAFRECIKLRGQTDVESQYRLDKWLTVAMGQPHGQWSIYGAEDAVEYYDSVGGDLTELRKSYDWAWLANYALIKRNLTANQ